MISPNSRVAYLDGRTTYPVGAVVWLAGVLGEPSLLFSPGSSSLSEPPDELLSEATRGAFCPGFASHCPVAEPLPATRTEQNRMNTKNMQGNIQTHANKAHSQFFSWHC